MVRIRIAVTGALVVGSLVVSAHEVRKPTSAESSSTTRTHRRRFHTRTVALPPTPAPTTAPTAAPPATPTTVSSPPAVPTTAAPSPTTAASTPSTPTTVATPPTVASTTATTAATPPTTRASVPPPPPVASPLPPLTKGQWQNITPPIDITYRQVPAGANYGTQTVALSPSDPRVVYLGSFYQGIWKTTDAGASWKKVSTGTNGDKVSSGANWSIAVDPTNADIVYSASGGAGAYLLWKSTDGGVNWQDILPSSIVDQTSPDVYAVAIDPADPKHLLVTFHSDWSGKSSAGVLESKDAGASWIIHQPAGAWGHSHYAYFITSSTWIVGMQDAGYWRTTDSGAHWTQVYSGIAAHGAVGIYRAKTGVLYLTALHEILRSTDNGASWKPVDGAPASNGGYYTIIGDGTNMYIHPGAAWDEGTPRPFYVSSESDGLTWAPYNGQNFDYGAFSMAVDAKNGIVYSSNWNGGLWRLKF